MNNRKLESSLQYSEDNINFLFAFIPLVIFVQTCRKYKFAIIFAVYLLLLYRREGDVQRKNILSRNNSFSQPLLYHARGNIFPQHFTRSKNIYTISVTTLQSFTFIPISKDTRFHPLGNEI